MEGYRDIGSLTRSIPDGSHRLGLVRFDHPLVRISFHIVHAVWLACTLSFILGLPSLGSSVAFAAATSIATIGLYISYGLSFSSSIRLPHDSFQAFLLLYASYTARSSSEAPSTSVHFLSPSRLQQSHTFVLSPSCSFSHKST
jgi:hypothetical protein